MKTEKKGHERKAKRSEQRRSRSGTMGVGNQKRSDSGAPIADFDCDLPVAQIENLGLVDLVCH